MTKSPQVSRNNLNIMKVIHETREVFALDLLTCFIAENTVIQRRTVISFPNRNMFPVLFSDLI